MFACGGPFVELEPTKQLVGTMLIVATLSGVTCRSSPHIRRVRLSTVGALLAMNDIDYFKALLQHNTVCNRILHRDFDLDSSGMRFGPHEAGIDDSDSVTPPRLHETHS